MAKLLVVDDDSAHRTMLKALISGWGHRIHEADDGSTAIDAVKHEPFDLVLMDIRMAKVSGIEALDAIKSINPAIPVVIMTAFSSVDTAIEALKKGAYDYLTKPLDFDKLKLTIERSLEHVTLREENRQLKERLGRQFDTQSIIGRSPSMVRLLETVAQVAPSEATVMITGESGTGKELIAGAIHYNSPRRQSAFVKINCAALTETLLESELFGHEKGAFTGADRRREGKFLQAHNGSIFLDEISETSLTMQVKLLRVLQEREITRVGGEADIPVNVRVIAATNKDLPELIAAGRFREDLFYRLNVVSLKIPSLKNRREDIPLLTEYFLKHFSEKNRKDIKGITPQAMDRLIRYEWPGNVRELMNAVERGVVLARSEYLYEEVFPIIQPGIRDDMAPEPFIEDRVMDQPLEAVEKATVLQTLASAGGNKSEAARRLGITRKTLHKKLKKYGVMP